MISLPPSSHEKTRNLIGILFLVIYPSGTYTIGVQKLFVREVVGPNDCMNVYAIPFSFKQSVGDDVADKIFAHPSGPLEGKHEGFWRVWVGQVGFDGSSHWTSNEVLCMQPILKIHLQGWN